jgi:DNA polymerase-3 subunit delta
MTFEQILADIKNNTCKPLYFLQGDEAYFIDELSDAFAKHVVDESAKDFDQTVVFGSDTSIGNIIGMAKRFPVVGSKQLVLVKEAQSIKKIEEIEAYAKAPQKETVLVFCYKFKKLDKRKAIYKVINKEGVVFDSLKIKDYHVAKWIESHVKQRGFSMSAKTSAMLAEYIGNDLPQIISTFEKLAIHVEKGSEITPVEIQKYVGISKTYNIFELQNAIAKKQVEQAFKIAQHFANNAKDHPMVLTVGGLYNYFSKIIALHYLKDKSEKSIASALKINPFFVKDYVLAAKNYGALKTMQTIRLLKDYDLKSKGYGNTSTNDGELLKEMLTQIMY